ncbi:MAG: helix-turn-helix transcriptional regulator [Flavobacteriales bacterium]|nr:helix-turn-helix transcriptional regulator [Flavobacteriales bacterium]
MKSKDSIIGKLLKDIPSSRSEKVKKKMLLASKISEGMAKKGFKKVDLMKATGQKNPSVITKWLSGTHNFTIDTLFEIEEALGIELVKIDNQTKVVTNESNIISNTNIFIGYKRRQYSPGHLIENNNNNKRIVHYHATGTTD